MPSNNSTPKRRNSGYTPYGGTNNSNQQHQAAPVSSSTPPKQNHPRAPSQKKHQNGVSFSPSTADNSKPPTTTAAPHKPSNSKSYNSTVDSSIPSTDGGTNLPMFNDHPASRRYSNISSGHDDDNLSRDDTNSSSSHDKDDDESFMHDNEDGMGSESDDMDGFSGIQSRGSMSSGSSKSKALAARSSLPCGLSMPILMSLVVLVPIIILIVVTAIPLDEAIRAETFFDEHIEVFEGIREAGILNFYENLNSSYAIFYPIGDSRIPPFVNATNRARNLFDVQMRRITNVMRNSDLELRDQFMDTLEDIKKEMAIERQRIDSRTTPGPPYRQRQVRLMDKLTRLILLFSKDSRGEILRHRLILYTIVRRIQTHLTSMSSSNTAIIVAGADPFYYYSNAQNLQSRYDSIISDVALVIEGGEADTAARLNEVKDSQVWKTWIDLSELLLVDDNSSRWQHVSSANVTTWFNAINAFYVETDAEILGRITDGEILSRAAVREVIIMVIAIVACLFALAAVIYYNNKEQVRLEKALDSTAVLAQAVQRFVPKNQLKTMGVRSITQVQPGMTTEVAQTITFSDIREFTRLSESMTRLELFDWLQNYVARMTKVVSEEKSYIMAFLGDGLGICSPQPTYAVKAAIKMHVSVEELNVNLVAAGSKTPVQIGVGVHAGIVVAGVFGDANRLSCTMIAPDVNFASRLEALTKSFGVKILASDSVIDQISSEVFSYRKVGKVQVKGSKKATPVYDIFQADSLNVKEFKETTKADFERAIDELDTNRPEADRIFEHLSMQARMEGIHDKTVELYRHHRVQTGGGNSDQASVLSFEKDGSFAGNLHNFGIGGGDGVSSPVSNNDSGFVNERQYSDVNFAEGHSNVNNSSNNNTTDNRMPYQRYQPQPQQQQQPQTTQSRTSSAPTIQNGYAQEQQQLQHQAPPPPPHFNDANNNNFGQDDNNKDPNDDSDRQSARFVLGAHTQEPKGDDSLPRDGQENIPHIVEQQKHHTVIHQ